MTGTILENKRRPVYRIIKWIIKLKYLKEFGNIEETDLGI